MKVDIYFANKIYVGANKTDWDFAKGIGEPSIYIALANLQNYPIIGNHQFQSGQEVVEGKDYELKTESGREGSLQDEFYTVAIPIESTSFTTTDTIKIMSNEKLNQIWKTCLHDAITKAKLSRTIISKKEVMELVLKLEEIKDFGYPPPTSHTEELSREGEVTAIREVQIKLIELSTDKFIEWLGRNQYRLLAKEREQIDAAFKDGKNYGRGL